MAAKSNGRAAAPGKKAANGHATNGHATNGHAIAPKSKIPPKSKNAVKTKSSFSLFSIVSRLLTWYSIITVLFRCPSTIDLLTDSSPKICKPYFQASSFLIPHLEPYYAAYAAPYVDAARPYYATLDKSIISPAVSVGKKYGAPRVAQAQAFGQSQWEKSVQPQVQKYQDAAKAKYDETLAPHVDKATLVVGPYIDIAKTNALQTYYGHILPTYTAVQPYALQGYGLASSFAVGTALPYSKWAWRTGGVFLDRTVFPKIRILYGENVEPQLVRIGERLGRYRDGKKLKAVITEVDNSSSSSSASSSFASVSSSVASVHATSSPTVSVSATATPSAVEEKKETTPLSEKEIREKAQEVVQKDLKTWQEKFAKAADEGSDDLEERITEITDRLIQNQAQKVGRALNIQLEETVKSSLSTLKKKIISLVKSSDDEEEKEEALSTAVRKAGVAIKDKAQAVRSWRQTYDQETNSLITKASEDTFAILDHIRDLGLQEIGMRWAWLDGVTHKDWAKYHNLKTKFDEWRGDVEKVVSEHPGLGKARAASEEVESKAMETAEQAAKELARVKETGRWKISTQDTGDDWSTKILPAAAANAGQEILKKVNIASEAVLGSQDNNSPVASAASSSVADAISSAQSVASSLSSSVIGTPQGSVESVISVGSASASSVADQASSSIIGTQQGSLESVASVAQASASSISAQASSSIIGTEPRLVEKAANSVKSAASVASESGSILSSSLGSSVSKSASDASSSVSSGASSASSTASKKVWGGAQAQFVEAKQIIFEDVIEDSEDDTYSEKIQSMASVAGDKYADVTNAVSEALLKPTTTGGTVETVTLLAAEKYSSALAAASVALYGTEQGAGESIGSVVSSKYADAVSAASAVIYGTPAPVTASIAAQASQVYSNALSQAAAQYEAARSIVSGQISGTPKPVHQEMYNSVESAYAQATSAAGSRLQSALSAASTAVVGTTPPLHESFYSAMMSSFAPKSTGALESVSAVASSKLAEGLSAASAHFEDAKSYLGAVQTGDATKQKLLAQMQNQYYAGIGMAHARYSEFVSAASSLIPTPTPTPAYQAALSSASASYASVVSVASSQMADVLSSISSYGASEKKDASTASLAGIASSRYDAVVSDASKAYESAASVLSEKAAVGSSSVSSAIYGSETPWTESVASAASSNWEALITKASEQVYGQPTPYFVSQRLLSEAKEYAGSATEAVASQYTAMASLISELVSGKEPDFTESVYARFSSAYYTGAGEAVSSASSYASEAFASASSVVGSIFTPPPAIESILDSAAAKVNEAVEAASIQVYGTQKGAYEQATESAASAYTSAASIASEKIYGAPTGYAEAAQSSISDAAASAQKAISEAIYGTPTGTYQSATNVAADTYSSATSVVAENIAAASAKISSAIYGPEQGAVESAQARLGAAVESARAKLAEFAAAAGEGASDTVSRASAGVEDFASSISSAISSVASHDVKDEL